MSHPRPVPPKQSPHNRDAVARYAYLLCGDRDLAEELVAYAVARLWPRHRGRIDNLDGYVRRTIASRLTAEEADIASLLDISPGTVKSRCSRALDSLRDRLALQEAPHG